MMRTLVDGLGFPEGPVLLDRGALAFTDIQRGRVLRTTEDGDTQVIAETGGGPNGLARARDGSLFVANNGGLGLGPHGYWFSDDPTSGCVQRIDREGGVEDMPTGLPDDARPNDLCFGPDEMLYLTDPRNWEDIANLRPGRVWRCNRDGSGLELLLEGGLFPNGLAFSPDGTTLYVAYSITQQVLAYPWSPEGLGEPDAHSTLPSGFPDGMALAADGTMIVCGSMGDVIHLFAADGSHRQAIEMPEGSEPTNCALGDGAVWVTMSGIGTVIEMRFDLVALPLYD